MKSPELAVRKFLESWKNRPVIGAVMCGSYVTGNPSAHSDIDLHIILDENVKWRERGNKVVDGFLIEYFANPPRKIREYFKVEWESRKRLTAHMLSTGKIILDRTGTVRKLKKEAKKWMERPFKKMSRFEIESTKYHIWDMLDNLEEVYERNGQEFDFVFFNSLHELFECYGRFAGYPSVAPHKVLRFLTSKKDMKKYIAPEFPDKKFARMFAKALKEGGRHEKMEMFRKLVKHVHEAMGGFEINGWKLRSQA